MISRLRQNRRRRRCRQMAEAKRTMLLTENPLPSAAMAMDRHRKAMPLWVVSVTSVAALPDPTRWNTPKKMIMKVNCFLGFFLFCCCYDFRLGFWICSWRCLRVFFLSPFCLHFRFVYPFAWACPWTVFQPTLSKRMVSVEGTIYLCFKWLLGWLDC